MKNIVKMLLFFLIICAITVRLLVRFSPDFRMLTLEIRAYVLEQPLYPTGLKYWAHECNDLRMFAEMMKLYQGAELDVIFYPSSDGGSFDVSHNPHPVAEHPLEDFFVLIAPPQETKVWIDFKNLQEDSAEAALREMNRLVNLYHVDKKRLIIESPNYMQLGAFRREGYYTSYYCSTDDSFLNESDGQDRFSQIVRKAVQSGNIDAVSFPEVFYSLVKKTGVQVDCLTWYKGDKYWSLPSETDYERRQLIEADDQVKVILVNAPSKYEQ